VAAVATSVHIAELLVDFDDGRDGLLAVRSPAGHGPRLIPGARLAWLDRLAGNIKVEAFLLEQVGVHVTELGSQTPEVLRA
jgi:hypothetical protein